MSWAESEDLSIVTAGIEFFLRLLTETPHTKSNCDAGLYKLAPVLLEKLFSIFSQDLGQYIRTKLLCLVLQIIKSFSPLDGVDDNTVKSSFDGTFELWMSLFVSALQGSLNLNLSIKKYILKVHHLACRFQSSSLGTCRSISPSESIINLLIFLPFGSLHIDCCLCTSGHMYGEKRAKIILPNPQSLQSQQTLFSLTTTQMLFALQSKALLCLLQTLSP